MDTPNNTTRDPTSQELTYTSSCEIKNVSVVDVKRQNCKSLLSQVLSHTARARVEVKKDLSFSFRSTSHLRSKFALKCSDGVGITHTTRALFGRPCNGCANGASATAGGGGVV